MLLPAIVLLMVAAVLHAGWNLLGKRAHPTTGFFLLANTAGALCLTPALVLYGHTIPEFPPVVWIYLAATGLCQAIYYAGLAGAYRAGDLSLAYPIARSSPVILVTLVTVLLGRGAEVSGQCIGGIALIVVGCFLLPMPRFSEFGFRHHLGPACLLAFVAALGTSGYSIIDDQALRELRAALAPSIGRTQVTALYAFLEGLAASVWLLLLTLARRSDRADLGQQLRTAKARSAVVGAGIYATYTIVLLSMGFVQNVSYVVAFRQLSVPLGAILGMTLLGESRAAPKLAGIAVITAGLVLVATG